MSASAGDDVETPEECLERRRIRRRKPYPVKRVRVVMLPTKRTLDFPTEEDDEDKK